MLDNSLRQGTVPRIVELENTDHFAVDMFPYEIKNRNLFYDRDHPKNLNPYSNSYSNYWSQFLRKCIEGKWVLDRNELGEETWVFMPPKLFFYINYIKVPDENRKPIQPRLRDNEWVMFTYFFIMDGFSGFEGDEIYTCNNLVKKLEDYNFATEKEDKKKYKLESWEEKKLATDLTAVNKKTGEYKRYVDPWVYLTEHYLINHNRNKPLGLPVYQNNRQNAMLLAARAVGKSYCSYLGDLLHEVLLGGARSWEEIADINDKKMFKFGSSKAEALNITLADISSALTMLPGKHSMYPKYGGAFFKNLVGGSFEQGNTIKHEVKRKNLSREIDGSTLQLITINKAKDLASGRLRRVGVEEVGFLSDITDVFSVLENSMKVGKTTVGSIVGTGTGGEQSDIEGSKTIYENPKGYNVVAIPDYYNRTNKKGVAGLFVSVLYADEVYKDENGNTNLLEALEATIKDRVLKKSTKDAPSFLKFVMFNPMYPKEMLMPKGKNKFNTLGMSNFRNKLVDEEYLKSSTRLGWFDWSPSSTRGVKFEIDLEGKREPLLEWGKEDKMNSLEGAFIMYEDVIEDPPVGLYYVVVDPVASSGKGSSQNSVFVYKADYTGSDEMKRDTIVGEWTGRHDQITDTYNFIIMMAKYYNAQIFQETNIVNFMEWCQQNEHYDMLFREPLLAMELIYKKPPKPSYYGRGVRMNKSLNESCYLKSASWLNEVTERNEHGIPTKYKFEEVPSLRLLSEAINYDPDMKTHFDAISSLYLIALLRSELHYQELEINIDKDEEGYYTEYDENTLDNLHGREETGIFLDY